MSEELDEIIRLTVAICRSGEPTTTDHHELINKRNQMVRDFKRKLEPTSKDWASELGFEIQDSRDGWICVEDGETRPATLNECVLWSTLQEYAAMLKRTT